MFTNSCAMLRGIREADAKIVSYIPCDIGFLVRPRMKSFKYAARSFDVDPLWEDFPDEAGGFPIPIE